MTALGVAAERPSERRTDRRLRPPQGSFSIGFGEIGSLHIVEEGELVLRIGGEPNVERVGRGDVILLPRGDRHEISDAAR